MTVRQKEPKDKAKPRREFERTKDKIKFKQYLLAIFLWPITLPWLVMNVFAFLFRGAPFAPTKPKTIQRIVALANIKPDMKAADLGSGDGRLVIALTKAGAETHGYEINPFLVFMSRWYIRKAGLRGKAFIHLRSFWGEDLSNFDVITVYGSPAVMQRLEEKLRKELRAGAKIISHIYVFPNWAPYKKESTVSLYIQKV